MTETTFKSFAYRLFHAIRANKKALIAELPPFSDWGSEGHEQREALRRLINALFQFEKSVRGAQPALAGDNLPKYFTKPSRSDAHPYNTFLNFTNRAARGAEHVVRLMLDCQSLLLGPTWQVILSIEGMGNDGVRRVIRDHIVYDRLPNLVKAVHHRSATGFSAAFTETSFLDMTFQNGSASFTRKHFFPLPNTEGNSLEQQIVQVNRFWTEIKHFARDASKDPRNWPSGADAYSAERTQVDNLLARTFRNLSPAERALIRKHPDRATTFVENL